MTNDGLVVRGVLGSVPEPDRGRLFSQAEAADPSQVTPLRLASDGPIAAWAVDGRIVEWAGSLVQDERMAQQQERERMLLKLGEQRNVADSQGIVVDHALGAARDRVGSRSPSARRALECRAFACGQLP